MINHNLSLAVAFCGHADAHARDPCVLGSRVDMACPAISRFPAESALQLVDQQPLFRMPRCKRKKLEAPRATACGTSARTKTLLGLGDQEAARLRSTASGKIIRHERAKWLLGCTVCTVCPHKTRFPFFFEKVFE